MTGEQWFQTIPQSLNDAKSKRQTFRQVYSFSDATLTFNHNLPTVSLFTNIYGTGRNTINYFPIPYVSTTLVNQIQIDVTSTQVIITKGGGAPTITNGIIVLEFLREE
jgi:hypothetical protein